MATNTTFFRARVPADRLRKAGKILEQLGMKPGDAFNMLLAQIELKELAQQRQILCHDGYSGARQRPDRACKVH